MSSSAESLGWQAFHEREVPLEVELRSPAAELAAALRHCQQELAAERAATRRAVAAGKSAAAEHAVFVFRLTEILTSKEKKLGEAGLDQLHRQLRVLSEQMLEALGATAFDVVDPLGRPFDEVADVVDVVGWRHGAEYDREVVAETIEPIVHHEAVVIRHGRVIMGAPAPAAVKTGEESPENHGGGQKP